MILSSLATIQSARFTHVPPVSNVSLCSPLLSDILLSAFDVFWHHYLYADNFFSCILFPFPYPPLDKIMLLMAYPVYSHKMDSPDRHRTYQSICHNIHNIPHHTCEKRMFAFYHIPDIHNPAMTQKHSTFSYFFCIFDTSYHFSLSSPTPHNVSYMYSL